MQKITIITGAAAVYPHANVDTDQIVPARFMARDRRDGYGDTLFHDLRFDRQGAERSDFVLNVASFRKPRILVAGLNFGCGSSRECAVWALRDYGIECVIAPSFSDIFCNNAVENGLLAISMPVHHATRLQDAIVETAPCTMTVDLITQVITDPHGQTLPFNVDKDTRRLLIDGLSKIDATLLHRAEIDRFEQTYRNAYPWMQVASSDEQP